MSGTTKRHVRRPARGSRLVRLVAGSLVLDAGAALAAVVTSPDEICSPGADPCVIASEYEVDSTFPLDFGLRTVLVTAGGRLTGTLDLSCGAFVSERPDLWMKIGPESGRGDVTITAGRSCSQTPALACLDDSVCEDAAAGTCSGGDGTIRLAGTMQGAASDIRLRAAGDVTLAGTIRAQGQPPDGDGGSITIESIQGSIEDDAVLDVTAGRNLNYDYGESGAGGNATLRAAVDVTVRREIQAAGGASAITVDAGRDALVQSSMFVQGRDNGVIGGTIDLAAGRDLRILGPSSKDLPLLNISGGSLQHRYYPITYGAPGGYGIFNAGGDIVVDPGVMLVGNSGSSTGYADDEPFNGNFYLDAGGDISFDGKMTAQGLGPHGGGWGVMSFTGNSVSLGTKSRITTVSAYSPGLYVTGRDFGPVALYGRIDVRGRVIHSGYGTYGSGGEVYVDGGDVTLAGRIDNGGGGSGGDMRFRACNLSLRKGARINGSRGRQGDGYGSMYFDVGNRMTTERGSLIRGRRDSYTRITYGATPPQFGGKMKPEPLLSADPSLARWACPVCGNFSVDPGEICDDGNTASGDGCSADCQGEF